MSLRDHSPFCSVPHEGKFSSTSISCPLEGFTCLAFWSAFSAVLLWLLVSWIKKLGNFIGTSNSLWPGIYSLLVSDTARSGGTDGLEQEDERVVSGQAR